MSTPTSIRMATPADAAAIARLHASEIAEGFLAALGAPFLERLYGRVVSASGSFALVSSDDRGSVDGFVAVAESTGRLYREFLVRDGVAAALRAAPRLLRHPARTLETLRHGIGGGGDESRQGAEVLALAVARPARGRGIGRALLEAATAELGRRGVTAAHVVTAATNEPAQRAYRASGFQPVSTIEVHRGTEQVVLVWR